MSGAGPGYTRCHPRWHRRRMSVWWWLRKWHYARFVLRELTCLAVAWFAVLSILLVRSMAEGPEGYARFLERMGRGVYPAVNAVAFVLLLVHAVTWFNLAPKAMVVSFRGKRVPDAAVAILNYGAWALLSALVAWALLSRSAP